MNTTTPGIEAAALETAAIKTAKPVKRPRIWSIAASDCSAGAGMQADLTMSHLLNVDCATLVTVVTAQSSRGVGSVQVMPRSMLEFQWQAAMIDGLPDAIKIGWLPNESELLAWLLVKLESVDVPVIWDPVLGATRGGLEGADQPSPELMALLKHVTVLTPNWKEACWLLQVSDDVLPSAVAMGLLAKGPSSILITGGEKGNDAEVADLFFGKPDESHDEPEQEALTAFRLLHRRLPYAGHGTRCHCSAALAAGLARGMRRYDAVLMAVGAASASLAHSSERASGYHNCFAHLPDRHSRIDIAPAGQHGLPETGFRRLERPLGLYGIVDNLEWLKRLLSLGIDTLQWRVKTPGDGHREQTEVAIELCREANVPLFINDDWQMAIELQAFGVHLGQEDLSAANMGKIAEAGLAVGISTHTDWEVARARYWSPSYIAFGPVYKPLSKALKYPPLGLKRLQRWHQQYRDIPTTCIGGITHQNIDEVVATGIESVAIVTDLKDDRQLMTRMGRLRRSLPKIR